MAISFSRKFLGGVIGLAVASSVGAGFIYEAKRDDWAAPDLSAMRVYRISIMSDEQIRKLHADAIEEAARLKRYDEEIRKKAFQEVSERQQRCSDLVYRTRNTNECSRGVPLGLMSQDGVIATPVDVLFEEAVLGVCRFMRNKEDARVNKCLPPK